MPRYVVHVGPADGDRAFAHYQVEADDVFLARRAAHPRLSPGVEIKSINRLDRDTHDYQHVDRGYSHSWLCSCGAQGREMGRGTMINDTVCSCGAWGDHAHHVRAAQIAAERRERGATETV